jgi:hypothetical protein
MVETGHRQRRADAPSARTIGSTRTLNCAPRNRIALRLLGRRRSLPARSRHSRGHCRLAFPRTHRAAEALNKSVSYRDAEAERRPDSAGPVCRAGRTPRLPASSGRRFPPFGRTRNAIRASCASKVACCHHRTPWIGPAWSCKIYRVFIVPGKCGAAHPGAVAALRDLSRFAGYTGSVSSVSPAARTVRRRPARRWR